MFGGEEERKWLDGLKAGDKIYVTQSYGLPPTPVEVVRVTATMIIVKHPAHDAESRYRRDSGRSVGGGAWGSQYLVMPTDEVREQFEVARLQRIVTNLRNKLEIPSDKPTLLAMIAALRPFVKKETIIPKEGE